MSRPLFLASSMSTMACAIGSELPASSICERNASIGICWKRTGLPSTSDMMVAMSLKNRSSEPSTATWSWPLRTDREEVDFSRPAYAGIKSQGVKRVVGVSALGGFGTNAAMADPEIVEFLAKVGETARYVTSVCSGSLLLGMAGLLEGYEAATHWACYPGLEATGARPSNERVAVDHNRFTGGGVTAGIDFGLTLLSELRDEQTAKMTQLMLRALEPGSTP